MATEKRLIRADVLVRDINADPYRTESEKSYDRCLVHRQPTVDAVEVVRCKDCKHWNPGDSKGGNSIEDLQVIGGCKWTNCCRREKDFCSYGERRPNVN